LVVDVVSSVDDKRMEMVPSKTIFESINAYVYLAKIDLLGLVERIQALGETQVVFISKSLGCNCTAFKLARPILKKHGFVCGYY
jgi:E3 ubiquitin-protein ligase DOA10